MLLHYRVALLSFVVAVSVLSVPIGATSDLYGNAVAHSDYTLNLQPPQETTHDIEASLDAIMKQEGGRRVLSDNEFAEAKQRMINVEKQHLRDMVRNVFVAGA